MRFTEEYKLSSYQDYGVLGSKEHIHILRDKRNGRICVKKVMDYMPDDIIEFRKRTHVSYFPELLEVVEKDGKRIIIEEYVDGITLEEYMMGEALDEDEAVQIAKQVCEALLYLHHSNPVIVYRDLKPENLMLTREGKVKLIDFDISRRYQDGKKRDTVLLGTVEYAAPEQFGYFQTDNRTDIYSFGVLFNYMLTGKLPSESITKGKYANLVCKCIEMEPSRRYQSMEEVLKEIGVEVQKREDEINAKKTAEESWMVPGFRSKTWWKMLSAVAGYVFIIYMCSDMVFLQENETPYPMKIQWLRRFFVMIAQFATVFLICDYRGISRWLKIYCHQNKIVRIMSYVGTWFVCLFVSALLVAIIEGVFGI